MFHLLFCCCARPPVEDDPTVIPTETTHLISPGTGLSSSDFPETIAVDHQKLQDRMGTIVRSKEGKMVNISARAPFILRSAAGGSSGTAASSPSAGFSSPPTPTSSAPLTSTAPTTSRHPPVLIMTPARARLQADSRYSSPSGSRSSSRRRTDSSDRYTASYLHSSTSVEREKHAPVSSKWSSETESESSVMADHIPEEPESGVVIVSPIHNVKGDADADAKTMAIAFSWSDT
ncbi:hypothetical protein MVEN_02395600 [Mycena venus]|uniref:Uncharacterized protein n=1 Tax=Mycena venus TaxID=2733690 RepID=A0A8H6X292_9AGAR|nr:hypothetical protein MVEN_02395600 [Mycena venus]